MSDFETTAATIAADHLDLIDNSIIAPAMREAVVRHMLMVIESRRDAPGSKQRVVAEMARGGVPAGYRLTGEMQLLASGPKGEQSIGWILALNQKFVAGGKLLAASRTCTTLAEAVQVLVSAHRLKPGGPI